MAVHDSKKFFMCFLVNGGTQERLHSYTLTQFRTSVQF